MSKADRRCELLDLVGHAVLVAVGDRPRLALARADEHHHALRPDRHMAGIRHDRIEVDLEPGRQLDAGEVLLDRVRFRSGLRNLRDVHRRSGGLELRQFFEIARGRLLRMGQRSPRKHECRGGAQECFRHVFLSLSLVCVVEASMIIAKLFRSASLSDRLGEPARNLPPFRAHLLCGRDVGSAARKWPSCCWIDQASPSLPASRARCRSEVCKCASAEGRIRPARRDLCAR